VVDAYDVDGHRITSVTVATEGVLPILHLLGDVSVTEADEGLVDGESFTLRVRDKDVTLVSDVKLVWQANEAKALDLEYVATESLLPKVFALGQNAPNPFNPTTIIRYEIPARVDGQRIESTHIALQVYDIRGRVVRTLLSGEQAPGRYSIQWNGRDERGVSVSSGVYFYRLRAESFSQTRKMLLLK